MTDLQPVKTKLQVGVLTRQSVSSRDLTVIHVKLNLLWLLLGDLAMVEGFPQSYIDTLQKEWEKVR